MDVTVRKLDVDDWKTLREIRLRSLLDAPEAFFRSHAEEAAFDEEAWRGRLSSTDWVTLIAEVDGRAVGMIGGGPAAEDERDPEAALMVAMWVEPESRGSGVADALTSALGDWAREQGHPRLLLWVYDAAPRAAAFYRRAGFTPTGRVEVFRNDGRPLNLMSQSL
ncbi:MAG TPA: GNAT family N-acetyltransferase [Kribbella sp.]|nr:GNAT family N-acetyltransferase [Kribbella sp.]